MGRGLLAEVGSAIAEEALEKGQRGARPSANIKRSPLCGRNFDIFPGPHLSGEMARCWIEGAQRRGWAPR